MLPTDPATSPAPRASKETKRGDAARRKLGTRLRQLRYVAQKREHLEHLEGSVQQLHCHVARCEGQLEVLRAVNAPHDSALSTAVEFFASFRHGYQVHRPHMQANQDAFLHSVMRHDLLFMNERGIEKLFAQWRASHAIFPSIEMVPTGFDVRACDDAYLVVAPGVLHLRISRMSLQCLCPHVLQNEWLVQRLVGQVLSMPIVNTFHFLPDGSITRMDTAASIVPALLALVGAENALLIVDGAKIQANGELTIP